MPRNGNSAIIEQLLADGITHMFGNPGTVEQGLLDAVERYPDFHYVLALQETVAAGIADGYARGTGGPAILQLHSGVGLGNAIGMLYQSKRGHTPLVAIAGEAGLRYDAMDAQMAADLVAMAAPVTKHAARVVDPGSVLRHLRRAIKIAMTPPRGPVFLSLPLDVLDAANTERIVPTSIPATASAPTAELVSRAALELSGARHPVILIGDGVTVAGAQEELTRVAEQLGADVWGVDSSEVNMSVGHPLWRGLLGHMFGPVSTAAVGDADAVLIVGTYVFPEVFPDVGDPFRPDARIVHIDLDDYEIAKNHPVTLGLVADPRATLGALSAELETTLSAEDRAAAAQRLGVRLATRAARPAPHVPDTALHTFLDRLGASVPPDVMVFDEALTTSPALTAALPPTRPGHYFATRGGSLGVGIPGAIGLKTAHPDRTVIGFTGDGGSMYTIQALATAARHRIGAKFVVCNNGRYRLLDDNIGQYWKERGIAPHAFPRAFDLSAPELGFVDIARGLGVEAVRVDKPAQADAAVERMLATDEPFLIDLAVD